MLPRSTCSKRQIPNIAEHSAAKRHPDDRRGRDEKMGNSCVIGGRQYTTPHIERWLYLILSKLQYMNVG